MIEETPSPVKGEIWIVRFDPTTGEEMKKTRPAVVINDEHMGRESLRIIVPVTEWQAHHQFCRWMFPLSIGGKTGLAKESGTDASQVKSLSIKRFRRRIGTVSSFELEEILAAVVVCIGYECPVCKAKETEGIK